MKTARPGYVIIKRDYSRTQIFNHMPDRFCTYCGAKGIYNQEHDYTYETHCMACDKGPARLYDADSSLPKLLAGESQVIDFKEDIRYEEITEQHHELEQSVVRAMNNMARSLSPTLYTVGGYGDNTQRIDIAKDNKLE